MTPQVKLQSGFVQLSVSFSWVLLFSATAVAQQYVISTYDGVPHAAYYSGDGGLANGAELLEVLGYENEPV